MPITRAPTGMVAMLVTPVSLALWLVEYVAVAVALALFQLAEVNAESWPLQITRRTAKLVRSANTATSIGSVISMRRPQRSNSTWSVK